MLSVHRSPGVLHVHVCRHLCNCHPVQNLERLQWHTRLFCALPHSVPSSAFQSNRSPDFCDCRWICLFLACSGHVSGVLRSRISCGWLLLLGVMFSGTDPCFVPFCGWILLRVSVVHTGLVHSSRDGHLGCCCSVAVVPSAAVTSTFHSVCTCVLVLLVKTQERGWRVVCRLHGFLFCCCYFWRVAEVASRHILNEFLLCIIFSFGFKHLWFFPISGGECLAYFQLFF